MKKFKLAAKSYSEARQVLGRINSHPRFQNKIAMKQAMCSYYQGQTPQSEIGAPFVYAEQPQLDQQQQYLYYSQLPEHRQFTHGETAAATISQAPNFPGARFSSSLASQYPDIDILNMTKLKVPQLKNVAICF